MYLALPDDPGGFTQRYLSSGYSGKKTNWDGSFRLRGYHPLWQRFPAPSATFHLFNQPSPFLLPVRREKKRKTLSPYYPDSVPCGTQSVWAVPLSLAATEGISSISVPPVTEMFHFTGSTPCTVRCGVSRIELRDGLPHSDISGSPVVRHLPRTFRRLTASFIAIECQGIHHRPMLYLLYLLLTQPCSYQEGVVRVVLIKNLNEQKSGSATDRKIPAAIIRIVIIAE